MTFVNVSLQISTSTFSLLYNVTISQGWQTYATLAKTGLLDEFWKQKNVYPPKCPAKPLTNVKPCLCWLLLSHNERAYVCFVYTLQSKCLYIQSFVCFLFEYRAARVQCQCCRRINSKTDPVKENDLLYHPMHLLSPFPHFLSIPQHSELTLQVRGYDRGILHISVNPYLEVLLFWGGVCSFTILSYF